jgi:hypothetical protein
MADSTPPSIAILSETTDQDGVGGEGGEEVKQSLESLLSRSDSASVDEDGDEGESSTLAVPSTAQGKSRDTSRKGRKISLNVVKEVEAIKEGYLDRAGRFQVYTLGNCPLYPQDCCNLTHTPVICTCTQPCVYIDTCLLLSVFIYCLRLFNLALEPTTTPLYCPTWLLSLQRLQQPLSTAQPGS